MNEHLDNELNKITHILEMTAKLLGELNDRVTDLETRLDKLDGKMEGENNG